MISRNWPAPAKLNLFLHITGRRDDGYHEIQTAMQMLDYGDSLDFHLRSDSRIRRISNNDGLAAEDLCVRAAALLQASAGIYHGVDIELHKRLPTGAGLGGGSSDAATCLVALNHLWQAGMEPEALAELALGLGADVPLFVRGHSAIAEGIGERISPMPLEKCWFMVAWPSLEISTASLYQAPDLTRNTPARKIASWQPDITLRNDFTATTCKLYPEVNNLLDYMQEQPDKMGDARMSGTGGAVFIAFNDERQAGQALATLPSQWQGFIAKAIDESPLAERINL